MSISQSPNDLMHESGNWLLAVKTDVLVCTDWLTAHSRVTPLLPSSLDCFLFCSRLFRTASLLLFFILSLLLSLLLSFPHIRTASSLYSHHFSCCLYLVGVYKRQEARLMLLLYQMRAVAHSSLSRITDETWAMDGFVSIRRNLKQQASDLLKKNQELWLSVISLDLCIYFFCFSLTDTQNITGNGTVTTWEAKISLPSTESSQCFFIISLFSSHLACQKCEKKL